MARSDILEILQSGMELPGGVVLFEDPPVHTMHRGLMSRVFTPRRMAALEDQVREFCAREFNDGLYDPDNESLWLFAYALAALVHETDSPDVELAAGFYDDATVEQETGDAGPSPWAMAKLPQSGKNAAAMGGAKKS